MREERSSLTWNRRRNPKCPPGRSCDGTVSLAHGAQRVHRAQAGGAQGEGAAMAQHDDRRGIRAGPPFVESLHENHAPAREIDRGSGPIHDPGRYRWLALPELGDGKNRGAKTAGKGLPAHRLPQGSRNRHRRTLSGRARKYITLVIDLESGRIIWVEQVAAVRPCGSFGAVSGSVEPGSRQWLWT